MEEVLTPDNKKQEILKYINENSDTDDPFKISRKFIISKFKDNTYNEKQINKIIDQCIDDDEIIKKDNINIEIIYPTAKKKEIKSKWKKFILPYKTGTILFLLYIITIIATYYTNRQHTEAAVFIPLGLLIGYVVFKFTVEFGMEKIPLLKKFNYKLLFCYLLTLAIIGSIAYGYAHYIRKEPFTTGYLLTSIIGCGAIGTLIYKFVLNKE